MTTATLTRPTTEWRWAPAAESSYDELEALAASVAALHELATTKTSAPSYGAIEYQAALVADLVK